MNSISRLSNKFLIASIALTFVCAIFILSFNIRQLKNISNMYSLVIDDKISSLIELSQSLENVLHASDVVLTDDDFYKYARIIQTNQDTAFISVLTNNIVQHVYPYDEYKHLIGTDGLLPNENPWYTQISIATNSIVAFEYYEPTLRKQWLVIKNPISSNASINDESLLGFVTLAFSSDQVFNYIDFSSIESLGYKYSLQLSDAEDKSIIRQSENYSSLFAINNEMNIYGTQWTFSINASLFSLLDPVLILLVFLSFRFTYYSIIIFLQKREAIKQQIDYEQYVDSLTGAYSRKKLETVLDEKTNATLLYIVLNDLKAVNEQHGREIGDGLLIAYTKRLQYNVKDGFVVRLGGGEFVVMLENEMPKAAIKAVTNRIQDLSSQPFSISGVIVNISAKTGYATYPDDSSTFAKLLSIASDRQEGKKK